jgi:hypothetical protein
VSGSGSAGGERGGSGVNSEASTPYGHGPSRSGLGSTVFVEEDEDEVEEMETSGGLLVRVRVMGSGLARLGITRGACGCKQA